MNDYTKNLCKRLEEVAVNNNIDIIMETIAHIQDLVSSAKDGWRYTHEQERIRLNSKLSTVLNTVL